MSDIRYSQSVRGDAGNHHWAVRFDYCAGYVGISQQDDSARWTERVLLTATQMRALTKFVAGQRMRRWVKDGQRPKARAR